MVPGTTMPVRLDVAREVRDGLMTWLLVACAGRPSHVTGIRVADVVDARVSILIVIPYLNPCLYDDVICRTVLQVVYGHDTQTSWFPQTVELQGAGGAVKHLIPVYDHKTSATFHLPPSAGPSAGPSAVGSSGQLQTANSVYDLLYVFVPRMTE